MDKDEENYQSGLDYPLDKLSFADVMQFADFGPRLALNQPKASEGIDPVYFLKFPVLGGKPQDQATAPPPAMDNASEQLKFAASLDSKAPAYMMDEEEERDWLDAHASPEIAPVQLQALESKNRRKRPRTVKTSEEVESQRMTHIAVERNRRKQMNEHLRVLRSLMPGSYVQRGDQASIIGGAIDFVRELEQLLQCLESQKRRRLFGTDAAPRSIVGDSALAIQPSQSPMFAPNMPISSDELKIIEFDNNLQKESAEIKSCLADVEVKLLGFDAMIKILSRRRPGQLLKIIAALEDLQFNILHTNITTIEQTVLYSFNVKIGGDSRFTAEDIASSVQQIFNYIHASTI